MVSSEFTCFHTICSHVLMQQSFADGAQLADDPQKVISFDGRPADVHCNQKCCADYDEDTFPCDVALTAIDMNVAETQGYEAQTATECQEKR